MLFDSTKCFESYNDISELSIEKDCFGKNKYIDDLLENCDSLSAEDIEELEKMKEECEDN